MDLVATLFEQAAERASNDNMDMNGLAGPINVETFVISKAVQAMKDQGVPSSSLGEEEDSSELQTLVDLHRQKVEKVFRMAGLDYLAGEKIDSWKRLEGFGTFAYWDGVPHSEAVRIMVLPCKKPITCAPDSVDELERFLRAAAFEAHVYGLVRDMVKRINLQGVVIDTGDRVLGLREFLREYEKDLLDEVREFLMMVPDVNEA